MSCMCDWPDGCNGLGIIYCDGCGGDLCICSCGGEEECHGCEDCDDGRDPDDEWDLPSTMEQEQRCPFCGGPDQALCANCDGRAG